MTIRRLNQARAVFLASRVLLLASLIAHGGSAFAASFTVGTGAGCTHSTIQSAITSANSSFGADTIRLTRSLSYESQANTINATDDLYLIGGLATCTQTSTDGIQTVVSGTGGSAAPVFRITAGTGVLVVLRHLKVSGGDATGVGRGGGIFFQGDGVLDITETTISNNVATNGGGIYALGTGTNAELIVGEGTIINDNTALGSGGGVSIDGPIKMTMTAPNTTIAFNIALGSTMGTGYGGGLEVKGEAVAYIGSPGAGGLAAIANNRAVNGGGISIVGGNGGHARVYLFTTDPMLPVAVGANRASNKGGGIYVQGRLFGSLRSFATVCASDFRIDQNTALDGSALYLDSGLTGTENFGGDAFLNFLDCNRPEAVRCASGVACNTIWGNLAVQPNGDPSDGATLRALRQSQMFASRFDMRGNRGGDAIRADGFGTNMQVIDCLLANNEVSRQLIRAEGASLANIDGCTFARNVVATALVLNIEDRLILRRTIIDQPGNLTLSHSGASGSIDVTDILASDISTLPSSPSIISGVPSFIDPANGNYRLRQSSLAVDFAEAVPGDDRDLDNQPRDQDLPGVPNLFGVRDLGAYERQIEAGDCGAADTIFCNGFEP